MRIRTSSATTAAMASLTATQLVRLLVGDHRSYVVVLLLTLTVLLALTTVKLYRGSCVESRAGAVLLALLSGGGVALAAIAGLPGQTPRNFDVLGALTLVLSLTVLGLVASERVRQLSRRQYGSPYAL